MIMLMDGSWQDGRGGWYICDGHSTPYGNTPDLRDKFIRGGTSAGSTGGTNSQSITLSTANLPSHSHAVSDPGHHHTTPWATGWARGAGDAGGAEYNGNAATGTAKTGISIGNTGSGQAFTVSTIPSYYSMIYIKKMA
jgi:hypothetical protein